MARDNAESDMAAALEALLTVAREMNATVSRLLDLASRGQPVPQVAAAPTASTVGLVATSLTPAQKLLCERVVNVFETGTPKGRYGAITVFADGPNGIRQVTFGRSQTTEYSNLGELLRGYVAAVGTFSEDLRPYVALVGNTPLVDDTRFKELLRRAGNEDPVMQRVQDDFFDEEYFQPALGWAAANGFVRALSVLVIYDSFIHSGRILPFLRARFPEVPPTQGGDEQAWIQQYVAARHNWLSTHERADLRASSYRTRDLLREVERGNWDLASLPILANGVPVDDGTPGIAAAHGIPFLGAPVPAASAAAEGDEEVWGEEGREPAAMAAPISEPAGAPALAALILANPRISLATSHVSGAQDQATARQNILDTAAGRPAARSSHNGAPGGTTVLDPRMLAGLLALAERYPISVSELAGGAHSPRSRHYVGTAADLNRINGERVDAAHPEVRAFMDFCRALGATEVLGPGDKNHSSHIHAAWPRPA